MPIYEYRCNECNTKSSLFVRITADPISPTCPACGSSELVRLVSSFACHRSADSRAFDIGTPSQPGPDYYKDPRNIGRWAEERMMSLGVDMHSEEYWNTFSEVREMISAAREGELPPPLND